MNTREVCLSQAITWRQIECHMLEATAAVEEKICEMIHQREIDMKR